MIIGSSMDTWKLKMIKFKCLPEFNILILLNAGLLNIRL